MSVLSDSQFDCVEDEWVDDEFDDAPFDLDAESDHGSQLLIEKLRSGFCPILLDATVLYSYVFYTLLKFILIPFSLLLSLSDEAYRFRASPRQLFRFSALNW